MKSARHNGFKIMGYGRKEVLDNWDSHFKDQIIKEFEKANLVHAMSAEDVALGIKQSVVGLKSDKHVVAVKDGKVIGAFFNIDPTRRHAHVRDTNYGWLYTTNSVPKKERTEVANALVNRAHEISKAAGYKFVATQIGTNDGERFFARHHGYERDPKNPDNWLKWLK